MVDPIIRRLEIIVENITHRKVEDIRREHPLKVWYKAFKEGKLYDNGYSFLRIKP